MKISLMVLSAGKAAGQALPINVPQFLIGRDPGCNLRPASAMISKRHCAVIIKNDSAFLRDFDSTNGTFLNDEPVKGEVPMKDGDILKVGPLSFKVVVELNAPSPAAPASTPRPVPAPALADISDDDAAAAALLAIEDGEGGVTVSTTDTADAEVPGGTTVMDMPAFAPPEGAEKKAEEKPAEKKPGGKKPQQGAAQDAAKAILDKLRTGKRK